MSAPTQIRKYLITGASNSRAFKFMDRPGGKLYWYATSPFHIFVFPTMLRNIIKKAAKDA